jgi:hypothetical protein
MSHLVDMTFEPDSIDLLKAACQKLGYRFAEGEKTIRSLDTGTMSGYDHVIYIPGHSWDIGVKRNGDRFKISSDEYLTKTVHGLAEQYHVLAAEQFAHEEGMNLETQRLPDGSLEIVMTSWED